MAFTEITPEEININPFTSWSRYVLVTAGNIEKCNTLLVTWGGFGVMWRKKTATIYIRQSRFTKTILDSQDYFTLSFLPEKHKNIMITSTTKKKERGSKRRTFKYVDFV